MIPKPVTDEARSILERLDAPGNVAVASSVLDGELQVDVLTAIFQDGEEFLLHPIAILVTGESGLFERLTDPAKGLDDEQEGGQLS